ncbi:MAG TPA: hypothetical protein VGE12_19335 [Noviherbaspirillum sp.]
MTRPLRSALLFVLLSSAGAAAIGQALETKFSCSATRTEDGEKVIYADNGEFRLRGDSIEAFRWESALYRSTHGFDCSIDEGDGLMVEVRNDTPEPQWRVSLSSPRAARDRRGYGFDRRMNCTIRLERDGEMLHIRPSCPALCGSRTNFSELSVNMKTGQCRYEE